MGGHLVDSREIGISVTDSTGADAGAKATVNGQTVTFHEVGQYTLHVTVDGNHSGRFTLHYTLLPAANQDGLHLSVDGQPTPSISTYGEKCNGAIVVQSGNAKLPDSAYNLLLEKDIPITTSFTDVDEGEWYAQAVHVLASLGILNGVGDGCFEPQRWITRAEFTAIAMRFAKLDTSGSDIFPDVNREDWFYDQVVCAVQYGWINGYADGTFRPDNTITRVEVTAIANRMLGRSADQNYIDDHQQELTQFTDVSPYYWAYYDIMEAVNEHSSTKQNGVESWSDVKKK